jgi:hypothetical protein
MDKQEPQSLEALINKVGTPAKLARLLGETDQAIWNCRDRGNLPKAKYLKQKKLLLGEGYRVSDSIWFGKAEDRAS